MSNLGTLSPRATTSVHRVAHKLDLWFKIINSEIKIYNNHIDKSHEMCYNIDIPVRKPRQASRRCAVSEERNRILNMVSKGQITAAEGVKMLDAMSLNTYEVLNHRWIVGSEPALRSLVEVLS